MAREDRFWSMLVAGFAAWMLVLQSISGAVAIGTGHGQQGGAGLDAFGNVLCIGDSAATQQSDDSDHRSCCTLGCATSAAPNLPPAAEIALAAPLALAPVSFDAASAYRLSGSARPGTERTRAPPATA